MAGQSGVQMTTLLFFARSDAPSTRLAGEVGGGVGVPGGGRGAGEGGGGEDDAGAVHEREAGVAGQVRGGPERRLRQARAIRECHRGTVFKEFPSFSGKRKGWEWGDWGRRLE